MVTTTGQRDAGSGPHPPVSPLRIAVVNQHLSDAVGGSELQCDLFARALVGRGHDVSYLAIGARSGAAAAGSPYRIRAVAARPDAIAAACRGVDVVYWRFGRRLLRGTARHLGRAGIPVVLAVAHQDDLARWPRRPVPGGGLRTVAGDLRDRIEHRRSFAVVCRLAGIALQREDQLAAVDHPRVRLVRNLVVTSDGTVARRPHPRPYVAWVGNLKPRKRPEVCLDLADALAPLGVDVLMAGALQDPAYRALTERDPARPNLHHLGRLGSGEVAELLAGAVCVPITYRPEGFSNVLLQAWTLGRPTPSLGYDPDGIIASEDLGGVADDDVPTFIDLVRRLVERPDEAAAAGDRARAALRARFDPVATVDALEALLREVVDAGRDA